MKIEIANLAALALASTECQKNWENTVNELLQDSRQLTSSVEAAMIDGMSGNYVARITSSMAAVEENIKNCPELESLLPKITRIDNTMNYCAPESIHDSMKLSRENIVRQQDQTDELIGKYEKAMDTLDDLNQKLWHELYPAVPVSAASLIEQSEDLLAQMRKVVEIDSRQALDISRIIRNDAEGKLKEAEDDYTRISHQVDILIYEIEPVLELIAVQGFNKLLCGGDAREGTCDEKCGGVLCSHCGGPGCGGAIDDAGISSEAVDDVASLLEDLINRSRILLKKIKEGNWIEESKSAKVVAEQRLAQAESRMEDIFDWIQSFIDMLKLFNRVIENDNSPGSHLKILNEILTTQLPFVDPSICRELERLNFGGEKPFKKPRAGEYASDAFYTAAKAAKLKFATEGLRKQLNEIYERVMMLNRISTGAAGGDSDDPEIQRLKDQIQDDLAYLEELIRLYPQETLTKKQYEILSEIINEINNDIIMAETLAADAALEMEPVKTEFDEIMARETEVVGFVDDTLEIKGIVDSLENFQEGFNNLTREIEAYTQQVEDLRNELNIKRQSYEEELAEVKTLTLQMVAIRKEIHEYHTKKDPRSKSANIANMALTPIRRRLQLSDISSDGSSLGLNLSAMSDDVFTPLPSLDLPTDSPKIGSNNRVRSVSSPFASPLALANHKTTLTSSPLRPLSGSSPTKGLKGLGFKVVRKRRSTFNDFAVSKAKNFRTSSPLKPKNKNIVAAPSVPDRAAVDDYVLKEDNLCSTLDNSESFKKLESADIIIKRPRLKLGQRRAPRPAPADRAAAPSNPNESPISFRTKRCLSLRSPTSCASRDIRRRNKSVNDFNMPKKNSIDAINPLMDRGDLVGDFSRKQALPTTTAGRHSDLKYISTQTMVDMLQGKIPIDYLIVDARYPYEYNGGHIKGAKNLYTKELLENYMYQKSPFNPNPKPLKKQVIIFHCEFSVERGPAMLKYLRKIDRARNQYPTLDFPDIYLLKGGYKQLYLDFTSATDVHSGTYAPMIDAKYTKELRHFRRKCKTLPAGKMLGF
ncbi:Oidioi.mRNA.OKI2018_I69.PAR.g10170.t1.cds [Oikopleura dioica]|uniref:protein-tyrosine-phosphatase n=1 Tax=Oikopleura dioica TaxID=34765 RepID=A0ABN7RPA6_OIKDI|nr:Oidioi.mRNA.OKI2018_I69.PAR.g10170.t1.cds [Oikopleura dioica]